MPKEWKYKSGANTSKCGDNVCNNTNCQFYDLLEFRNCVKGVNFRTCDLYHVRPSVDKRTK